MSEELKDNHSNDVSPSSIPILSCLRSRPDGIRKSNHFKVSFPEDESQLITGYLEAPNPWEYAENVSRDDLISAYQTSCEKHGVEPLSAVLDQLQTMEIDEVRTECLDLKGEPLAATHCESLEEVLKRVQFKNIDLESTALDDEGSVALFDMVEYYESATHLNISGNKGIGIRGWQACSRMIKKTHCLEELNARNVPLNEPYMPILSRALKISTQLQVLKLENACLSGRSMVILVGALKLNTGLKELYLADNGLSISDAAQLGALLRSNWTLQLLDVSNNCIQDGGANHILDGLVQQAEHSSGGLCILILWNNRLSRNSSNNLARALTRSRTLEMLNIGRNCLTNECLHAVKTSLQQNRTLLRIGMQSTHISCEGAVALAECIANNPVIQRIDLRDNNVQVAGLMALAHSMKMNHSVSQLDLDDSPKRKLENSEELKQYHILVQEIRDYCARNELAAITEEKEVVEESETTPERRVRLSGSASRKISLTCETLMRAMSAPQDVEHPHLLSEPRRSGGRLRSPAPSPVPSPASSPVPSPSRNRFQVSRVSETSPATSPSTSLLSSSPSRFFSSPGMSRFRVTLVEPSVCQPPAPKPVISSPSGNNVTVGFSFKLNDKEITINTSVAGSCGIVTSSNSAISENEPKCPLTVESSISSQAVDMPQDTDDLEVMQLMNKPMCENNWEQESPCLPVSLSTETSCIMASPKPLHPNVQSSSGIFSTTESGMSSLVSDKTALTPLNSSQGVKPMSCPMGMFVSHTTPPSVSCPLITSTSPQLDSPVVTTVSFPLGMSVSHQPDTSVSFPLGMSVSHQPDTSVSFPLGMSVSHQPDTSVSFPLGMSVSHQSDMPVSCPLDMSVSHQLDTPVSCPPDMSVSHKSDTFVSCPLGISVSHQSDMPVSSHLGMPVSQQSDTPVPCPLEMSVSHKSDTTVSYPPGMSVSHQPDTSASFPLSMPVSHQSDMPVSCPLDMSASHKSDAGMSDLHTIPSDTVPVSLSSPLLCTTASSVSVLNSVESLQLDSYILRKTGSPATLGIQQSNVVSAQPAYSEDEYARRIRSRKISWVAPVEPQRTPSSLEKLLGLFQHPSSFFNKTQPQYKATAAIVNQQPVANSSASFLLTAGPLAGAVKEASFQQDGDDRLSSPEGEPETDYLNNNGRDGRQAIENFTKSCSRCTVEEREQVRTRVNLTDNIWCAGVCGASEREPSPSEDTKEADRLYSSMIKSAVPANGLLSANSSSSVWVDSNLPVTAVRLVGGASSEPSTSRRNHQLVDGGLCSKQPVEKE
ncbi:uncharacterized protein [Anabrus simplex]|uniref:uncharacterized protein n=1 Tax=Anabrus simplex TaxID=316456 RepID=UPI0035A281EF